MKKVKLIAGVLICFGMIYANFTFNTKRSHVPFDIQSLNLTSNANAELIEAQNFQLVHSSNGCYVCYFYREVTCEISEQCCDNQEPYC